MEQASSPSPSPAAATLSPCESAVPTGQPFGFGSTKRVGKERAQLSDSLCRPNSNEGAVHENAIGIRQRVRGRGRLKGRRKRAMCSQRWRLPCANYMTGGVVGGKAGNNQRTCWGGSWFPLLRWRCVPPRWRVWVRRTTTRPDPVGRHQDPMRLLALEVPASGRVGAMSM